MNPLFLFLLKLLFYLGGIALCLLLLFWSVNFTAKAFGEAVFIVLKNKIRRNPALGQEEQEGGRVYRQGRFTLRYKLLDSGNVKFTALKRRLWGFEEAVRGAQSTGHRFWLYRQWTFVLNPFLFVALLGALFIVYFSGFEPQEDKIGRLRFIVSKVLKVGQDAVNIEDCGQVKVSGKRRAKSGGTEEDISYNFNIADWLTRGDAGYVYRTREDLERVTYPVTYDGKGNVVMQKDNKPVTGHFDGSQVTWDAPQGDAKIQAEKIYGEGADRPQGKVIVEDR